MAEKESSNYWQAFYNAIQDLQIKCSLRNDVITPEIAKYFEQTFFEHKFYWIAAKAMTEIEHKTEMGLKGIAIDCKAFDLRFKDIKGKNKELLQAEGNIVWETGLREDGQLFSGLRTSEKSANYAYCAYTNIESTFYNFYNRFKEIAGLSSDEITQIKKNTMLEPITEEKLKEYGFNDLMIERLKTWEDYECKVISAKGCFYASNTDGFIYSGELGYDKCHNIGIERFKTFDAMFQKAFEMKSIDLEIDPSLPASNKKAIYSNMRSYYNGDFNNWLQRVKNWDAENETQYKEFLTKEVWIEYLAYKQNQKEEQLKKHEAEKASWQIGSMAIQEKKQKPIPAKLQQQFESDSFQYFEADAKNCLEDWQYYEPIDLAFADRYDLDKEAYLKTFFNLAHDHETKFDEKVLIERLINNLQKAKHPVFIEYRKFLETKIEAPINISLIQQTTKAGSMQTIYYPTDLKYADVNADLLRDDFKKQVNSAPTEVVFKHLNSIIEGLKSQLGKAKNENPATCKRMLVEIRYEALRWYHLDHIEDSPCNMLLFSRKNELKWYIDETEKVYNSLDTIPKVQTEQTGIVDPANNFLHSTIEDWLYPFKEENRMSETDYNILVSALKHYFETGSFPTVPQKIQVGSVNKKRFGWALNQIYRTAKSDALPLEYLRFAKENISLFDNVAFDQTNYTKSNFYKYFTTETK